MEDLCEKIKDSEVKVEIESHNSNLADTVNKVRHQYDQLAKQNLKDTEDWYQNEVSALAEATLSLSLHSLSLPVSPPSPPLHSLTTSKLWRPKTTRPCSLERRT